MSESADRDGMFIRPRLLESGTSVVTCGRCRATVEDTDAHICDPTMAVATHARQMAETIKDPDEIALWMTIATELEDG